MSGFLSGLIDNFPIGGDFLLQRDYVLAPGVTITQAYFAIKQRIDDHDLSAILLKSIDSFSGLDGQIVDDGQVSGTCSVVFAIGGTETALGDPRVIPGGMSTTQRYVYGIKLITDLGRTYAAESGYLDPVASVINRSV